MPWQCTRALRSSSRLVELEISFLFRLIVVGGVWFNGNFSYHRRVLRILCGNPFKTNFGRVNADEEFALGQVHQRSALWMVCMASRTEGFPFAGSQYLQFAINNFHGDRALVYCPGQALFRPD